MLNTCLRISLDIVLIRAIVNAAEVLGSAPDYGVEGIFSWTAMRLQRHWIRAGVLAGPVTALFEGKAFLFLSGTQIVLSVLLLSLPAVDIRLLWLVFLVEGFVDLRTFAYGRDGSDRMHILVFLALCVCYSFTDPRARAIGLIFIALQSMLAYFVSGAVKAISTQWRTGKSILLVLCSDNYGAPRLGRWMAKHNSLCKVACWSVIAFEMSFSFFVFLGPIPTACVLLAGIFFHLSVAATMSLNGFVWSFPATYPAIWFLSVAWQQYGLYRHLLG